MICGRMITWCKGIVYFLMYTVGILILWGTLVYGIGHWQMQYASLETGPMLGTSLRPRRAKTRASRCTTSYYSRCYEVQIFAKFFLYQFVDLGQANGQLFIHLFVVEGAVLQQGF